MLGSDKMKALQEPIITPKLRKQVLNLDEYIESQKSITKLGSYSFGLNNLRKNSLYKKLLNIKKGQYSQAKKENRNRYLKSLVKSNSFYFPKELALDECKKPNSKDIFSKNLKLMEEIAQKEKNSLDNKSRKNSNITSWRKESSFLDNKRNRSESIYEEIDKKKSKKKKKKEEKEENVENDEEENNYEENENDDGEISYNDNKDYQEPENDDDSQNYNYSDDDGDYY